MAATKSTEFSEIPDTNWDECFKCLANSGQFASTDTDNVKSRSLTGKGATSVEW